MQQCRSARRRGALGVDETAFLAATGTHPTEFVTGIVALNGRPRLLDVVPGRSGKTLSDWVSGRSQAWRDGITVAALDPFRGYATALRSQLPGAIRVLDAFHVTRLGLAAVDEVRRRVQQQTLHRRGHKHDPLYRIRRLLHRAPETLSERAWARLETGLILGDPHGDVAQAWMTAHELRYLYRRPALRHPGRTGRLLRRGWVNPRGVRTLQDLLGQRLQPEVLLDDRVLQQQDARHQRDVLQQG
jgi:transposase